MGSIRKRLYSTEVLSINVWKLLTFSVFLQAHLQPLYFTETKFFHSEIAINISDDNFVSSKLHLLYWNIFFHFAKKKKKEKKKKEKKKKSNMINQYLFFLYKYLYWENFQILFQDFSLKDKKIIIY